jgi:hypothetical protein
MKCYIAGHLPENKVFILVVRSKISTLIKLLLKLNYMLL